MPSMTVAQNIYLGDEKFFNRLRGLYIAGAAVPAVAELPRRSDGAGRPRSAPRKKQMVEIARAVHHKARVIIFDEPTATLTPEEKHHFFNLVRAPARAQGVSIIFITHALEEALADLRPHHRAARRQARRHRPTPRTSTATRIVQAMVGRDAVRRALRPAQTTRTARPQARRCCRSRTSPWARSCSNTSFSVYRGPGHRHVRPGRRRAAPRR